MMERWALFLSGRGSTAQSALEVMAEKEIRLVVSSKKSAFGLKRAARMGIPTLVLEKSPDWNQLSDELKRRGINRIFLLGFMKIIPEGFVNLWKNQILNIHPSLLPNFPGAHGLQESFQDEKASMGVTIHRVTPGMDEGPRLLQKQIFLGSQKRQFNFEQVQLINAIAEQNLIQRVMQKGVSL